MSRDDLGNEGTPQLPEEFVGPWELQCTLSGVGDTWIQLISDGSCSCGTKVGKGRHWTAIRKSGEWRLEIVLEDKLKRPYTYEGLVGADDLRGTTLAGSVMRGSSRERNLGPKAGEFTAYKLQ